MNIIYIGSNNKILKNLVVKKLTTMHFDFININEFTININEASFIKGYNAILLEHSTFQSTNLINNAKKLEIPLYVIGDDISDDICLEYLNNGVEDTFTAPIVYEKIIHMLNRLGHKNNNFEVEIDDFIFNLANRSVTQNSQSIKITANQYLIFFHLVKNKNRIVSREELLEIIWGSTRSVTTRTIDSHIKSIRKKLSNPSIVTIRGIGYMYISTNNEI